VVGKSLATIRASRAIASKRTPPIPSHLEGRTKTSAAHRRSGTSARTPRNLILRRRLVSFAMRRNSGVWFPSRPAMTSNAFGLSRTKAKAFRSRSKPFGYSCRAAATRRRASGWIPRSAKTLARRSGVRIPSASGSRPRGTTSIRARGILRRELMTSATCPVTAWNRRTLRAVRPSARWANRTLDAEGRGSDRCSNPYASSQCSKPPGSQPGSPPLSPRCRPRRVWCARDPVFVRSEAHTIEGSTPVARPPPRWW
jgi:hypothetical protein